jgi:hypothetical protein
MVDCQEAALRAVDYVNRTGVPAQTESNLVG